MLERRFVTSKHVHGFYEAGTSSAEPEAISAGNASSIIRLMKSDDPRYYAFGKITAAMIAATSSAGERGNTLCRWTIADFLRNRN